MNDEFFTMHKLAELIQSHNCGKPECCCVNEILSRVFSDINE